MLRLALRRCAPALLLCPPLFAQAPTFLTEQVSLSPLSPAVLEVADVTGDGAKDLLVGGSAAPTPGAIASLYGDGFGGFTLPSFMNLSANVVAIVAGDVNSDGKRDLLAATDFVTSAGQVAPYAGDGLGGFSALPAVTLSGRPTDLKLADVDADGDLDLLHVELTGPGVGLAVVRYSDGAGNFGSPGSITTANNKIALSDFNADGKHDLLVIGDGSLSIKTLPGNGVGGFGSPTVIALPSGPDSAVAGDFTQDGRTDICLSVFLTPGVWTYPGNGVGGFGSSAFTALSGGYSRLSAADANLDGKLDLAGIQSPSSVLLMNGTGSGTFNTPSSYNVGLFPRFAALTDVDADGRADLFAVNLLSPTLTILRNRTSYTGIVSYGTGTAGCNGAHDFQVNQVPLIGATNFQFRSRNAPPSTLGLAIIANVQDVPGSDPFSIGISLHVNYLIASEVYLLDLVSTPQGTGGAVLTLPNLCALIGSTYYAQAIWVWVPGCPALPFGVSTSPALALTFQGPAASTTMPYGTVVNYGAGTAPTSIVAADFDGDGRLDLACGDDTTTQAAILLGAPGGTFSAATTATTGQDPASVGSGDFDEDGNADLVTADKTANTISLLVGDGLGGFAAPVTTAAGTAPLSVAVGDLDSDSHADVVAADRDSNDLTILLGDGLGGFATATVASDLSPREVRLADVDSDGDLDALVTCAGANGVAIHLGDGLGGFGAPGTLAAGTAPQGLALADINEDGRADLLVASTGSNELAVRLGLGAGAFGTVTTFATGLAPVAVATGDFNDDCRQDVVVASRDSNALSFLPGNALGSFAALVSIACGTSPVAVLSLDLNADLKQDVVGASSGSNDVGVLLHP